MSIISQQLSASAYVPYSECGKVCFNYNRLAKGGGEQWEIAAARLKCELQDSTKVVPVFKTYLESIMYPNSLQDSEVRVRFLYWNFSQALVDTKFVGDISDLENQLVFLCSSI